MTDTPTPEKVCSRHGCGQVLMDWVPDGEECGDHDPSPAEVIARYFATAREPLAVNVLGVLRAAGYQIVRSEDRRDEAIVREVLSAPLGYSTGANDPVLMIRADDADGFDCGISTEDDEAYSTSEPTRWAALVAACREAQS